jgi:hypothetical protein
MTKNPTPDPMPFVPPERGADSAQGFNSGDEVQSRNRDRLWKHYANSGSIMLVYCLAYVSFQGAETNLLGFLPDRQADVYRLCTVFKTGTFQGSRENSYRRCFQPLTLAT